MRSSGWVIIYYHGFLRKRRNLETERDTHTGAIPRKDWSCVVISPRTPKISRKPLEAKTGAWNGFSLIS